MVWSVASRPAIARSLCGRRVVAGFTLIELLVVFTLLALLLSIAVPRYLHSIDTAKEKVRQQNLATLRDALDKFRADQGRFPNSLPELVTKQYLRYLPLDPVSGTNLWTPLPHPAGLELGVYDAAPPPDAQPPPPEELTPESKPSLSLNTP